MLKLLGESEGLTTETPPSIVSTVGTGWEVLTGAGVRDIEITGLDLDPTSLAAWQEEQRRKEALRRL